MSKNALTDLLNSTTMAWTLKPTALERRIGRLLRGPDGDHGDGAGDGGSGDGEGTGVGEGEGAGDEDGTILGNASDGAGDGEGSGDGSGDGEGDDANLTDEQKAEKTKKAEEAAAAEDKVPEGDYELATIKVGEGEEAVEYALDSALLAEVSPQLKEAGLGNKGVQKLAETIVPKLYDRFSKEQQDVFAAARKDWADQARNDPELGGKNWKATEHNVSRALDQFIGPMEIKNDKGEQVPNQFRQFLNETGLGNHPMMIKAFAKIGAALGEDGSFARGSSFTTSKPKSREEVLYPEDAPTKQTT